MERHAFTPEDFLSGWNELFPDYPLSASDLKKPHAVMGALFKVFDRLGIDRDAVLSPLPEDMRNENMVLYWDLIPVINVTRVFNHLVSVNPQFGGNIFITNLLQPSITTSHSLLILMFNLMLFHEQKLQDTAALEEDLFVRADQRKALEERINSLRVMLNEQAEEKGKRVERIEKLDHDIQRYEEELKQENDLYNSEKQELECCEKKDRQVEMILEQKKSQRDALMAEIARNKALRVYDADDIKVKAEKAAQNVVEAEEKLNSLQATLMEKEKSLKNLHVIKPTLETANNLLCELMNLSNTMRNFECGDLESDSKDGELHVLNTEMSELHAQLTELQVARTDAANKRLDNQSKRQQESSMAQSALREAVEKNRKESEQGDKALKRLEEIKNATGQYETRKSSGMERLVATKNGFRTTLKTIEDMLLEMAIEAEKKMKEKLRSRKG